MPQLAGQKIEEMADIQAKRKRRMVMLCSAVGLFYLAFYSVVRFAEHNFFLGPLNLFSSLVLACNLLYLYRSSSANHASLILSVVLIVHALLFLTSGDSVVDRLLWIYPILAVVVFVNPFIPGVIASGALSVLTSYFVLQAPSQQLTLDSEQVRFLLSLTALFMLCNIYAFYHWKVLTFVRNLYSEGIEDLAYRDQLTGLANRWSFENWATDKLEEIKQNDTLTAMVFLDIDNFKSINDTYGHDVGDRVLKHFASRLRNNIRNKDRKTNKYDYSIARFAGDEFVLLIYDIKTAKDLDNILQRVCDLFTRSYQVSERINELTISAGVALYPHDAETLPELTRCADKAMYAAKHGGKNQYRFYNDTHAVLQCKQKLASVTSIKKASGSYT
ncbi:GGDEF domain-containing protein [Vibrio sp. JPW-9-11-11]|uniref:GGDEF domain-containing protein n=1 Tax=Vibrio sp. JPW-9-11-11 TaxID=1416532 RepID=UPI001593FA56|nr:GGDEF domain-containing protein [Vibrio sp. JPW-9-11-11]NVD08496.1 GGDEF domain-containing protein [Vibrio sp. JPW-9-11-11]